MTLLQSHDDIIMVLSPLYLFLPHC